MIYYKVINIKLKIKIRLKVIKNKNVVAMRHYLFVIKNGASLDFRIKINSLTVGMSSPLLPSPLLNSPMMAMSISLFYS